MKLELKAVKHIKSMSEETPAYSATVYRDGKPICIVSNHGTGGSDRQWPVPGMARKDIDALEADIKATFPPVPVEGMEPLPMDLELWCHLELGRIDARKLLKRKLVFRTADGKIFETKNDVGAEVAVRVRYPGVTILNSLPFDEAARILGC